MFRHHANFTSVFKHHANFTSVLAFSSRAKTSVLSPHEAVLPIRINMLFRKIRIILPDLDPDLNLAEKCKILKISLMKKIEVIYEIMNFIFRTVFLNDSKLKRMEKIICNDLKKYILLTK